MINLKDIKDLKVNWQTEWSEGRNTLEIKGEVTDIIYQNEVNSYTIAVFETDEEETTIVG